MKNAVATALAAFLLAVGSGALLQRLVASWPAVRAESVEAAKPVETDTTFQAKPQAAQAALRPRLWQTKDGYRFVGTLRGHAHLHAIVERSTDGQLIHMRHDHMSDGDLAYIGFGR